MTHSELLAALVDKIPKMNKFDLEILRDIIAGIALKDNSLYDFYKEVTTSNSFIDVALIKKVSEKYSVPVMYREHIDERFDKFKENLKTVCALNRKRIDSGKEPGYDPDKWLKDRKPMFSSTEKRTIEKIGGLEKLCSSMLNVGFFDYLKTLFEESATDVSKVKYALMMDGKNKPKQIGG